MKSLSWTILFPLLVAITVLNGSKTSASASPQMSVEHAPVQTTDAQVIAQAQTEEMAGQPIELAAHPTTGDSSFAQTFGTKQAANAFCEIRGAANETLFQGDCIFSQFGGNGSFTIESPYGLILDRESISVYIIEPGVAEVRGLTTSGINSMWGRVRRSTSDPACWVGGDFTICAR